MNAKPMHNRGLSRAKENLEVEEKCLVILKKQWIRAG